MPDTNIFSFSYVFKSSFYLYDRVENIAGKGENAGYYNVFKSSFYQCRKTSGLFSKELTSGQVIRSVFQ